MRWANEDASMLLGTLVVGSRSCQATTMPALCLVWLAVVAVMRWANDDASIVLGTLVAGSCSCHAMGQL
eukprot:9908841-Alexandrium_andersonii.AAC.1